MSYDQYEESTEDGQPIEFYEFIIADTTFRFTNGPRQVMTNDGRVWKAAPISTDGIKVTGESTSDALQMMVPSGIAPAQIYINSPPSSAMLVRVFKKQLEDNEIVVKYQGTVSQVDFSDPGVAKLTCETLSASMQRTGLRLQWARTCQYALYDPVTCKVNKADWGVAIRVLQVDGFDVRTDSLGAYPDGRFSGGFIEWDGGARGPEYRTIESHSGFDLVMFGPANDLFVGMVGTAYPGCRRTIEACESFNNRDNSSAIPNMPGVSPFDGTPIFY